jgi:uncharacterized small protein (DUF1192 family)
MNEEFVNIYIEMMSNKISDLTKSEMLLQTRLAIAEKIIASLQEEKNRLEASLNKKASKTTKEENSF